MVLLAACAGPSGAAGSGDYAALEQHPFQAPALGPGGDCPVSRQRQVTPNSGGTLTAVGDDPAYVSSTATVVIGVLPGGTGSGKHGGGGGTPTPQPASGAIRQVWLIAPFSGPLLVRAKRIDGPGSVRFGVGQNGAGGVAELRMSGGGTRWISVSTNFSADGAGCYAFQVDGSGLSYPIVLRLVYTRD